MKIIGLSGQSKVGRQFVADYLAFRGFVVIESRAPIYEFLDAFHKFGFCERLAEKLLRETDPPFFCDVLNHIISEHSSCTDLIVIPDVTHETEAEWIRQRGVLWHISWNDDRDLFSPHENEPIVSDHGTPDQIHEVIDDLILLSLGIDMRKSVSHRVLRNSGKELVAS